MHSSCSLNSVLTTALSTMNCGDRDVSDDVLVTYSVCQICYKIHSTRRVECIYIYQIWHCCQRPQHVDGNRVKVQCIVEWAVWSK